MRAPDPERVSYLISGGEVGQRVQGTPTYASRVRRERGYNICRFKVVLYTRLKRPITHVELERLFDVGKRQ